ncbi:hypothetical protein Y032_0026g1387 [Ancylostoma ceylanicum]|uniref:Uncharacterized protein n=1 Tax=Ancylostoma ceylanicum TaxID=53326 RepID=A0A016UWG5_9BILA|nr:hypothetical protein Y032_0026g1387 [Ancylostoma ceylanicum]
MATRPIPRATGIDREKRETLSGNVLTARRGSLPTNAGKDEPERLGRAKKTALTRVEAELWNPRQFSSGRKMERQEFFLLQ